MDRNAYICYINKDLKTTADILEVLYYAIKKHGIFKFSNIKVINKNIEKLNFHLHNYSNLTVPENCYEMHQNFLKAASQIHLMADCYTKWNTSRKFFSHDKNLLQKAEDHLIHIKHYLMEMERSQFD